MGFFNSLIKSILGIDIDAIKEENESLRSLLSEEQEASNRKDIRLSKLESETKSLKREVANLKSRKTLLEGDVSALKHQLAESHEESAPVTQEYRYTIDKIETWRVQNEKATGEIEKLRNELDSAHKEYEVVTKKLAALQKRYDSVKSQLEVLQEGQSTDIAALMSERKRLSDRIAVLTSENKHLTEVIEILTGNKRRIEIERTDEGVKSEVGIGDIVQSHQLHARDQIVKNKKLGEIISALQYPSRKLLSTILVCGDPQSLYDDESSAPVEYSKEDIIDDLKQSDCSIEPFSDGKKWGFRLGSHVIIEPLYIIEPVFIGEYFKVCQDNRFGLIDKSGEYVLDVRAKHIEALPNGAILYSDDEDWYLLGIEDSMAVYDDNDEIQASLISDKYKIYQLRIRKNSYIGQKPIEFYFFEDQIFKLDKSSDKWTLWYTEEEILLTSSDDIKVTNENLLKLVKDDLVLYLAPDGTILEESFIDEPEYLERQPLSNGYFIVKQVDGYWGIVDDENNYAVLAQYDMISPINRKFLRFQSGNKWGIMNIDGDILIDAKYNSIESYQDGSFTVTLNNPANPSELLRQDIEV